MHTTASSLVAIAQYFWQIRTSVLYGNQQKFNIEAVNDYPLIRFMILIIVADLIRDLIQTEISDLQVSSLTAMKNSSIRWAFCAKDKVFCFCLCPF